MIYKRFFTFVLVVSLCIAFVTTFVMSYPSPDTTYAEVSCKIDEMKTAKCGPCLGNPGNPHTWECYSIAVIYPDVVYIEAYCWDPDEMDIYCMDNEKECRL